MASKFSRQNLSDDVSESRLSTEIDNMIAEGGPVPTASAMKIPAGSRRVIASSQLAGDLVRNLAGEELGKIEDLMVDLDSGHIAYALLSCGGFLGIGDKRYPVPWHALRIHPDSNEMILDLSRSVLERAPKFDKDSLPDMSEPSFDEGLRTHYGEKQGHRNHAIY